MNSRRTIQTDPSANLAPPPTNLSEEQISAWPHDLDTRLERVLANAEQNKRGTQLYPNLTLSTSDPN